MDRQHWIDFAEIMDVLRVMPKIIILTVTVMYAILTGSVWTWFVGLAPTLYTDIQFAALVGVPITLLAALGAMLTSIVNKYIDTGTDWSDKERPPPACPTCGREH